MVDNNGLKTEKQALYEIKNKFYKEYMKYYKELSKKKNELEELKKSEPTSDRIQSLEKEYNDLCVNAQVAMYSYNSIHKSKTFEELSLYREWLVKSAINFGKLYNEEREKVETNFSNMTEQEKKENSARLADSYKKFRLLKQNIQEIDKTLSMTVSKSIPVTTEPKVEQRKEVPYSESKKEVSETIQGQNNNTSTAPSDSIDVLIDRLEKLNESIFNAAKDYCAGNDDFITKDGFVSKASKLIELREDLLVKLGMDEYMIKSFDSAIYRDIEAAKECARKRIPTIEATPEEIIDYLQRLNEEINDLKIEIKREPRKRITSFSYEEVLKELELKNIERENIISSTVSGDLGRKEISDLYRFEGLYNEEGGYTAFHREGGTIGGRQRNMQEYKSGRKQLKELQSRFTNLIYSEIKDQKDVCIKDNRKDNGKEIISRNEAYDHLVLIVRDILIKNNLTNTEEESDGKIIR